MSKYTTVTIFTKKGNLLPYMRCANDINSSSSSAQAYYGKEREIQLALATRYERTTKGTKLMCKISCPVNPLPVKGEFEAPSYGAVCRFLTEQGWTKKGVQEARWFE